MITPLPSARPVVKRPYQEKRSSPRSERNIRVLLLAEDSALEEPFGGWIINTSRGGVRLRVPREGFPVGTLLLVRAPLVNGKVPWTPLRVCNTRRVEKNWEMGCEFVRANASSENTQAIKSSPTRIDPRAN